MRDGMHEHQQFCDMYTIERRKAIAGMEVAILGIFFTAGWPLQYLGLHKLGARFGCGAQYPLPKEFKDLGVQVFNRTEDALEGDIINVLRIQKERQKKVASLFTGIYTAFCPH